jgi:hypothetical protein
METYHASTSGCLLMYRKTIIGFTLLMGGLLLIFYGFGTAAEEGLYGLIAAVFVVLFWCFILRNQVLKNRQKSSWLAAHYYFQYKILFKSAIGFVLIAPLAFGVYFMDLGWTPARTWCVALLPMIFYTLGVVFFLLRGFSRALDGMYPTSSIRDRFVNVGR